MPTGSASTGVAVETIAGEIAAAPLNTSLGNLETHAEAHVHTCTGLIVDADLAKQYVQSVHGTEQWVLVSGLGSITLASGSGSQARVFADNADQGNPSFLTIPRVTAMIINYDPAAGFAKKCAVMCTGVSTTGFTIGIYELDGGSTTGGTAAAIHWTAYGKVA